MTENGANTKANGLAIDKYASLQPTQLIPYARVMEEVKRLSKDRSIDEVDREPWAQLAHERGPPWMSFGTDENRIIDIVTVGQIIVALDANGLCWSYDRFSDRVTILNANATETVRSVFHNRPNQSVMLVATAETLHGLEMLCRAIKIDDLIERRVQGVRVFPQYVLEYPDFIEFDEMNQVLVTKHHSDGIFRVWNMSDFKLLHVLKHPNLHEFKICCGLMILIF